MRKAIVGVILGLVAGASIGTAAAGTDGPLRYREIGGDGPALVIKGRGALQTEDSTTLELVQWEGTDAPVVYRVIQP
jgi:hypothetical protein